MQAQDLRCDVALGSLEINAWLVHSSAMVIESWRSSEITDFQTSFCKFWHQQQGPRVDFPSRYQRLALVVQVQVPTSTGQRRGSFGIYTKRFDGLNTHCGISRTIREENAVINDILWIGLERIVVRHNSEADPLYRDMSVFISIMTIKETYKIFNKRSNNIQFHSAIKGKNANGCILRTKRVGFRCGNLCNEIKLIWINNRDRLVRKFNLAKDRTMNTNLFR